MRNHMNSTHTKIKFYIIFIYIFHFYDWYSKFYKLGGGRAGVSAGGVISSEKWENRKTSTNTKIKFSMLFISIFFFYDAYLKFPWLGGSGRGLGMGNFYSFYYFINVIIWTLHISSFIVVYIDIWHIVTVCLVWCVKLWNYICEIVQEDSFSAGPPKSIYFLCNSFSIRFSVKVSKQNFDGNSCLSFLV